MRSQAPAGTPAKAPASTAAASVTSSPTRAGSCSPYRCVTAASSWSQLAKVGASWLSMSRRRPSKTRHTSRTWHPYSNGDHRAGAGRSFAPGRARTSGQGSVDAVTRVAMSAAATVAAWKPHSGHRSCSVQVQSLSSGTRAADAAGRDRSRPSGRRRASASCAEDYARRVGGSGAVPSTLCRTDGGGGRASPLRSSSPRSACGCSWPPGPAADVRVRRRPTRATFRRDDAQAAPPARKRLAVVLNPTKMNGWGDVRGRIAAVCEGQGWAQPLFLETRGERRRVRADPGRAQRRASTWSARSAATGRCAPSPRRWSARVCRWGCSPVARGTSSRGTSRCRRTTSSGRWPSPCPAATGTSTWAG